MTTLNITFEHLLRNTVAARVEFGAARLFARWRAGIVFPVPGHRLGSFDLARSARARELLEQLPKSTLRLPRRD